MKKIKNNILSDSKEIFNELLNNINRDYFYKLEKIQTKENQKYGTYINIINHDETKVNDKLTSIYENEILKYSLCIISQIFCENLKKNINNLCSNYFQNNKEINEILSQKAIMSLNNVTQKIKENLEKEIKLYFPEKDEVINNNNNNTSNDINENKINNRNVFRKQEMDDDFLNEFD